MDLAELEKRLTRIVDREADLIPRQARCLDLKTRSEECPIANSVQTLGSGQFRSAMQ